MGNEHQLSDRMLPTQEQLDQWSSEYFDGETVFNDIMIEAFWAGVEYGEKKGREDMLLIVPKGS